MKPYQITGQLGILDSEVLRLGEKEVKEYLSTHNIFLDSIEVYQLYPATKGYPLALAFSVPYLSERSKVIRDWQNTVYKDIFDYFDEVLFANWSRELYKFMLQMGGFESFTLGLASMVSGHVAVQDLIDEANHIGSFLFVQGDEYVIEPFFRKFLQYKQERTFETSTIYNIYHNAGLYYELGSDLKNALKYYSRCNDEDKVHDLLIRNSNMHPGVGSYLEVEEYYRALPKEKILESPALILGAVQKRQDKELFMREFSITSNLPSALNGGKDFSSWVPKADMLYPIMKTAFPLVLGLGGIGLADIAYAEVMLETANKDTYKILRHLNQGLETAATKGAMENQFAGVALLHRLYLAQGNTETAYSILIDFKKIAEQKQQTQILPNLRALQVNYYLRTGKNEKMCWWRHFLKRRNITLFSLLPRKGQPCCHYFRNWKIQLKKAIKNSCCSTPKKRHCFIQII